MGCDYYADEYGQFELEITTETGQTRSIRLTGLEPGEEIHRSLLHGRDR